MGAGEDPLALDGVQWLATGPERTMRVPVVGPERTWCAPGFALLVGRSPMLFSIFYVLNEFFSLPHDTRQPACVSCNPRPMTGADGRRSTAATGRGSRDGDALPLRPGQDLAWRCHPQIALLQLTL